MSFVYEFYGIYRTLYVTVAKVGVAKLNWALPTSSRRQPELRRRQKHDYNWQHTISSDNYTLKRWLAPKSCGNLDFVWKAYIISYGPCNGWFWWFSHYIIRDQIKSMKVFTAWISVSCDTLILLLQRKQPLLIVIIDLNSVYTIVSKLW